MLLWRLEGSCETGDIVLLHADLIESVCCRLLSTDTIKDESLWEAESALAQLWEHEDRVGANLFKNHIWGKSHLWTRFLQQDHEERAVRRPRPRRLEDLPVKLDAVEKKVRRALCVSLKIHNNTTLAGGRG